MWLCVWRFEKQTLTRVARGELAADHERRARLRPTRRFQGVCVEFRHRVVETSLETLERSSTLKRDAYAARGSSEHVSIVSQIGETGNSRPRYSRCAQTTIQILSSGAGARADRAPESEEAFLCIVYFLSLSLSRKRVSLVRGEGTLI